MAPAGVMAALKADDPDHDYRQIAIIDREGKTAAPYRPGHPSVGGASRGRWLRGVRQRARWPQVLDGIVAGYLRDPAAELEFRLLAARLEGGRNAGGQIGAEGHLTERSAAIFVASEPDHFDIDARSTCMTTRSPNCAACWKNSRSTRSSIATVVIAPTWR